MELLPRILRAAQARISWQLFLTYLGLLLAVASSALLLVGILQFLADAPPFRTDFLLGALAAAFTGALYLLWRGHPTLSQTAHILDGAGKTKDRYYTAYLFGQSPAPERMEEAAIAECQQFIQRTEWRPLTPIRFPRTLIVALAPLAALAFLQLQYTLNNKAAESDVSLQKVVDQHSKKLSDLAAKIDEARREHQSAELELLVKELRNTSKRISEQRPNNEEIRKAAMREFSSLEAMLQEMMRSAQLDASPEELKSLAEALKQNDQEEAAKLVEEGKFEEAAKKLEELAKKLKEASNPEQIRQQLAESMREGVDRLSEDQKKQVAEQMKQLAQAAASMQDPEVQEALKKLQQLMKDLAKMQQNRQAQKKGQEKQQQQQQQAGSQQREVPMTAESLKQLIEALEQMKRQLQEGGDPQPGEGDQMLTLQMPGQQGEPGNMPGSMDASGDPSGNPGSELDFGTTDTPFGAEQPEKPKAEGPAKRITGSLGEGETLREFIGAAGDDSKAKQRYKEIYQATQAEAQDAVTQETIPLGSRLLIRRYFESIRPKE